MTTNGDLLGNYSIQKGQVKGGQRKTSDIDTFPCDGQNPYNRPDMLLIGITGGLASGKSTLAHQFQGEGAYLIDADLLARTVVAPGRAAWKDIVRTFGKKVLRLDRTLDRPQLADLVFHDQKKLATLTSYIYPRVAKEQHRLTKEICRHDPEAIIIYDAAMLIEANAHTRMNKVILVNTPQPVQISRACQRDGLTKTQALERIRQQIPFRKKRPFADYIIQGTLSKKDLQKTVKTLFREFSSLAKGKKS